MRRAVNPFDVGIRVNDLHDIQLAARCPSSIRGVCRHHPERAPKALPGSGLDACLDASIGKIEFLVAANSTRRVPVALHGLLTRADGEAAIRNRQVVGGVPLELVITPAGNTLCGTIPLLYAPVGGIQSISVKVIAPYQLPLFLGLRVEGGRFRISG